MEQLEGYYEKEKNSAGDVGNWHPFKDRDPSQPQGRLLFLDDDYDGLYGNVNLVSFGRFVGVAPEARATKAE